MVRRIVLLALLMGLLGACAVPASPASTGPAASAEPDPTPVATPAPTPTPEAAATPDLAACATRQKAIRRDLRRLDRTLVVGGRELAYDGTIVVMARNGKYDAADSIPNYAFLDLAMAPIEVEPGGRMPVEYRGATLTGLGGVTRVPFGRFTAGDPPDYDGPDPRPLQSGVEDSVGWIEAPDREGTWVVELEPEWLTDCYEGQGVNWVVVRTR